MKKLLLFVLAFEICTATAQDWSKRIAETVMTIWKDSMEMQPGKPVKWAYDQGVVLKGIEGLWLRTGDKKYFDYIQKSMDFFVNDDGSIRTYKLSNYNIDNVLCGRNLLMLYNVLGKEKYYKAALLLREQLKTHPRTKAGGFWHKQIYPWQMWLDGLYMGQPFYAAWARRFSEDSVWKDITRQFVLMETLSRDAKTGLLYHGYDESRTQKWADKATGKSPHVWARAMGWYGMALVDVLESFPKEQPGRDSLVMILQRFAKAIVNYQDKKSGLWFDIVDMPSKEKNYPEASASSMLVYTLAKAVRLKAIPANYLVAAQKGYASIINTFIKTENGQVNLHGTVSVSGLGGEPYRDGSYAYYMSEKVVVNDPKGVGAFLLASNEVESISMQKTGAGKKVAVDYYFNRETKKDVTGRSNRFHYVWEELDNNGFSLLGEIFLQHGADTTTIDGPPTAGKLKGIDVYLIVDPDTEKETAVPNFMQQSHANEIADWVSQGGTLVLLANDSANAEFIHFNLLAEKFGIHFNGDSKNKVTGTDFPTGAVMVPAGNPIFKSAMKLYIKELSSLRLTQPATSLISKNGFDIMAVASYGKGRVFAVGDPWLYNEYTDGRKLPAEYQNYQAAHELVSWLLSPGR